jgi:hypothetical protein
MADKDAHVLANLFDEKICLCPQRRALGQRPGTEYH